MANMLLNRTTRTQNDGNSLLNQINQLKNQGPSNIVFERMYQNNPSFKQFADSVRDMTPEEAFRQYGLDFDNFRNQRW